MSDENKLIMNISADADSKGIQRGVDKSLKLAKKNIESMAKEMQTTANRVHLSRESERETKIRMELQDLARGKDINELSREAQQRLIADVASSKGDFSTFDPSVYLTSADATSASSGKLYSQDVDQILSLYKKTLPTAERLRVSQVLINNELNKQLRLLRQVAEGGSESKLSGVEGNIKKLSTLKQEINAEKEQLKNIEKLRKETKNQGEELSENEKLLQHFNENFDVTGIVGIRAFRTITRYGTNLLKSLIELTIETQTLENGFSSLNNKINTFKNNITEIKKNLGSSITSVLEPIMDIFNAGIGYISSLTKGLSELSFPLKQALGLITLMLIVLPSVVSLFMILRYYGGKVVKTFLAQASATNKAAAALVKYRAGILATVKTLSLAVIFALALYNIFKKTADTSKEIENLGLSSFDDVNILQDAKSQEDEINGITAAFQKMEKAISLAVATLSGFAIIKTVGGWFSDFFDKQINTAFDHIGESVGDATGKLSGYSTETVTAATRSAALQSALSSLQIATSGLVFGVTSLIQNWDDMGTAAKVVSTYLMALAGTLTIVAAGLALVNYVKYKKMITVMGFVAGGLAITSGVVAAMNAAKNQAAALNTSIPKQAHGGVTTGTAIAMVGEGKYNEAIVPLGNSPEFSAMKEDITNAVLAGLSVQGGRSNQPINITVNVDKDYIYKSYNQVAKQNGR